MRSVAPLQRKTSRVCFPDCWLLLNVTPRAPLVGRKIPRRFSTSLHMFWSMLWSTLATGIHVGFRLLKMGKNPLWSSLVIEEARQWAFFLLSFPQSLCDWRNSSPGLPYQKQRSWAVESPRTGCCVCGDSRLQNTWTEIELSSGYLSCHQGCPHFNLLGQIVVGKKLREF
jgi:hypothetical protein